MKLNQLKDNLGATANRKRVGRGIGSGTGKTAGRGMKGQKSRSGVSIKGFEGGQMPIYMRLPKRGFNNDSRLRLVTMPIGRIQNAIDNGKLDASSVINEEAIVKAGVISHARDGIKLVAGGEFHAQCTIDVHGASASVKELIHKVGGSIKTYEKPAPLKIGKRQIRRKNALEKKS